ncbi:MAG: MerR family transcriptional regulator [Chloroflexi bacterium]|nr:MerR family transcriptional regulator [Chloroflexota bacterium]
MTTSDQAPSPWLRRLYLPAYSVGEAARYAGTTTRTVAYWHYQGGALGPALPGKERRRPLSYFQLVEVAFVATFRELGVPLQRIRKARAYACQQLNFEYPFAEHRWQTEGKHMLLDLRELDSDEALGRLIVADAEGQLAWQPLVAERFAQFEYDQSLAVVWHVAGRDSPVTIDPRVAFGAPTVKGMPTWAIRGRWTAGESLEDIQEDFCLEPDYVKHALKFEGVELPEAA